MYAIRSYYARRVNAATRSDPVGGLDIFADDLNCYGGKIEYYQWQLVGEGKVLAPVLQPYPFQMSQDPARASRFLIKTPYVRITSYNVCYTKLLRMRCGPTCLRPAAPGG